jgi:hypothetical protein
LAFLVASSPVVAKPRELPFTRLSVPSVGTITHVTGEASGRVWMLSETMDVLLVKGRAVSKVRDGSWAFEPGPGGPTQFFFPQEIAAANSALIAAGRHYTGLGNSFAALARLPLTGPHSFYSDGYAGERIIAEVRLGAVARSSSHIAWASGGQTSIGSLLPDPDDVALLYDPGNIWLAQEGGIWAFDGWTWKFHETAATAIGLWFDGVDTLFVLFDGGVSTLRDGVFAEIPVFKGFAPTSVLGTAPDRVWFFGPRFLALYDGKRLTELRSPIYQVHDVWRTGTGTSYFVGAARKAGGAAVSVLETGPL